MKPYGQGKTYKGAVDDQGAYVVVHPDTGGRYALPWRLDLRNHSPTGLNWGYGGSGPSQCALALLADHLGDDQATLRQYQGFKWAVVAKLPIDEPWELTSEQVDFALARLQEEEGELDEDPLPF